MMMQMIVFCLRFAFYENPDRFTLTKKKKQVAVDQLPISSKGVHFNLPPRILYEF